MTFWLVAQVCNLHKLTKSTSEQIEQFIIWLPNSIVYCQDGYELAHLKEALVGAAPLTRIPLASRCVSAQPRSIDPTLTF
jgi:hypothetical protein